MGPIQDALGRQVEYLRLSVTERCNFRCAYCLPQGGPKGALAPPLSVPEVERLVRAFAGLGVWKVRMTGGEPTLRPDIDGLVRAVAAVPGIRRVGLTTNGYRLTSLVPSLRDAGLSALNVSVDSLDPARFQQVTGCGRLEHIVAGVEAALAHGVPSVKVNAVLLRGMDERELDRFLAWTQRLPVTVRFIELMQTGENAAFFQRHHLPAAEIRQVLERRGWQQLPREQDGGPATNFGHADHVGRVGLIAPYSAAFCDTCNRVRVSATGGLRLCLFGEGEVALRPLLQGDAQQGELMQLIASSIRAKPPAHALGLGRSGATRNLAMMGG
jgi:cyclic pyranopterin phosphate synthase